jgi:hypothetical protein
LRQLESDLAHMNRLGIMGELAASLAHEITQPIATARNNARAALNFLDKEPPELGSLTMLQKVTRGDDLLIEAHVRVAFVCGGRARPIRTPAPGDAGGSGADSGRGAVSLTKCFARGLFCGRSTPISRSNCKKLDQAS